MNSERVKLLERFVREDPSDPFPRYALALELADSDQSRATELLTGLVSDHPHYLPVFYQLAQLLLKEGKMNEARQIALQGIEVASSAADYKTRAELAGLIDEAD